MLIKLSTEVKAGDDKVFFPIDLPPHRTEYAIGNGENEEKTLQTNTKTIKGLVRDIYSLPVLKQEEEISLQELSLQMRISFEGEDNQKVFRLVKPYETILKRIGDRMIIHSRDMTSFFGHLQNVPSLTIVTENVKGIKVTHAKMIVPPYTSILCDYEWFFPALGLADQLIIVEEVDDTKYFGFQNHTQHTITLVSSTGLWEEKIASVIQMKTLHDALFQEGEEIPEVPDIIRFVYSGLPRTEQVTFLPGDGTFSVFLRQFKEALSQLLTLHNMNPRAITVNGDGKKIELGLPSGSLRNMKYLLHFKLLGDHSLPVTFDDDERLSLTHTLDPSTIEAEWKWQDPNLQYKLPALEDYFPLSFLTDAAFAKTGYIRDYGDGSVLAIVNQNGDFESEVFTLPTNQNALPVYVLDERNRPFSFPVNMILYMTIRLL
ncbi:unnamed protein product [Sphagnum tenellum]